MIKLKGVQTPITTTVSTQNINILALESAQDTSFLGNVPFPERAKNIVVADVVSDYALTPLNLKKLVKNVKRFKAQLRLFTNQFKSAVDKKIKKSIEPFFTLHGCIDEMERRVKETLKEMSALDLTIFDAAL